MNNIGNVYRLKVDCLGNSKDTLGVVFDDYGTGQQLIFPNGNYDGFSLVEEGYNVPEMERLLEYIRVEESLINYHFTHVAQLQKDFERGVFDKAFVELSEMFK